MARGSSVSGQFGRGLVLVGRDLHGGPGMTHDYFRALPGIFDDRQVVLYDQLRGLVAHLGFQEAGGFHLLGHSWGGMLAQEYMLSRPPGLRSLILSDTTASTAAIMESMNPVVFAAMMGNPEIEVTGTLRDWTTVPRLAEIDVPTLVLAGEHDELLRVAWGPLADHIPAARLHVFAGASHNPFLESPDEYRAIVAPFLAEHEGTLD